MIAYFVEDIFYLIYKDRIIRNELKDIISKGRIVDKNKFIEVFLKIIKKEKIKSKLFGDSITILDSFCSEADKYFLEAIFLDLGFIKVDYLNIAEFLNDEDGTYVEINDSYMVIYLDEPVYLDLNYFKDIPKILDYLKVYLGEYLILFGVNKNIPKIKHQSIQIYYLESPDSFITQSLLKVKKYGA